MANVTNVGMGCGGPWRRARRAMPKRTVKSYGSDILEAGIKLAVSPVSDGGTVIAGEITKQPYKPLRGECRVSGVTVAFYYNNLPRRIGARYSPRPLIEGGKEKRAKPRAKQAARFKGVSRVNVSQNVIASVAACHSSGKLPSVPSNM